MNETVSTDTAARTEVDVVGTAVSSELLDLIGDAADYATAAKAPNTIRAYGSAWSGFVAWCDLHGFQTMPATPRTVAIYLTDRANSGIKVNTLRIDIAAISSAHQAADHPFNTKQRDLVAVWAGIRRSVGVRPEKKTPIMKDDLKEMLACLDRSTLAGKRDTAMMMVGFGAALRRSELVALDVEDITICQEGVKVLVRRSKTDQEGAGTVLGIASGKAVAAVQDWITAAGLTTGPLFRRIRRGDKMTAERLTAHSVRDFVKRLAEGAGLDPAKYAGHSLRAGLATSASIAGATLAEIMEQTRHTSVDMAKSYIRDTDIWRANVSALVL